MTLVYHGRIRIESLDALVWETDPRMGSIADDINSEQDTSTPDSIARAKAAQQRERAAFTAATDVRVNHHGKMLCRSVAPDYAATKA